MTTRPVTSGRSTTDFVRDQCADCLEAGLGITDPHQLRLDGHRPDRGRATRTGGGGRAVVCAGQP